MKKILISLGVVLMSTGAISCSPESILGDSNLDLHANGENGNNGDNGGGTGTGSTTITPPPPPSITQP